MTGEPLQVPCAACGAKNRVPRERLGEVAVCGRCRAPLLETPVALGDEGFERFLARSDLPVVVDFWAAWCGPCRAMAPHFERAAAEQRGRVLFAKVDTEAAPATAARLGIQAIPTLVLFEGGREVARHSGAVSSAELGAWLAAATG